MRANGGDYHGGSESLVMWPAEVAATLDRSSKSCGSPGGSNQEIFSQHGANLIPQPVPIQDGREMQKAQNGLGIGDQGDPAYTLDTTGAQAVGQPVPYDLFQITAPVNRQNRQPGDPCHTLARDNAAHAAVAFNFQGGSQQDQILTGNSVSPALAHASNSHGGHHQPKLFQQVAHAMTVRRLTPVECERLQGFPDNWTAIPWRKKTAEECPDGPRYKALGNSMAVNCMAWIGERIAAVDAERNKT
jgi:DNA (cytosine-5)-methyltransferase 1